VGGTGEEVGTMTVGVLVIPISGEEQAERPMVRVNRRLRKTPVKRVIPREMFRVLCRGLAAEGIAQIIN